MLNYTVLKNILSAAALAGLLAGLLLTGVQKIRVSPIILEAEVYEDAAAQMHHAEADSAHENEHEEWEPQNGLERTAYTAAANISVAVGFSLLLGAAICLRGGVAGWQEGLLWGLAGYAVFFIAPSLGLPPEVPGTEAAPLADRQLWWLFTAVSTAVGLSLLSFSRRKGFWLLAVAVLVVPHIVGAPQPVVHHCAGNLGACIYLCDSRDKCRVLAGIRGIDGMVLSREGMIFI